MNKFFATLLIGFSLISFPSWAIWIGLSAYESGDYATALREFKKWAEKESNTSSRELAQFYLGKMYYDGKGVPQDYKTALKWYTLAAEQGSTDAMTYLGFMYLNALGVSQDYKIAVKWFTKGAEQGNSDSQNNLAIMYVKGHGVILDKVYAHMWWNISASNGDENAVVYREIVAKEMTPSQLEKAQDLARECVANDYKGC